MAADIERITGKLRGHHSEMAPIQEALTDLLQTTDSRAVGFWRVEKSYLRLVGFAAQPDMPEDVQTGFAAATEVVSLKQIGLGIVQAVNSRKPTVAHVEPQAGLVDSASWLAKFAAVQSLSVPIYQGNEVSGVLAMSTAHPFEENDAVWQLLIGIAEALGRE